MKTTTLAVTLVCSVLTSVTFGQDEEGFRISNLNPFKRVSAAAPEEVAIELTHDAAETPASSGFRFPTLPSPPPLPKPTLPNFQLPKFAMPARPAGPSAWERLNSGTRTFFVKTKSAFMPWTQDDDDIDAEQEFSQRPPARRIASRPSRDRRNKQNLMSTLFGPKEETPEIESVNDYLDLPRPTPY